MISSTARSTNEVAISSHRGQELSRGSPGSPQGPCLGHRPGIRRYSRSPQHPCSRLGRPAREHSKSWLSRALILVANSLALPAGHPPRPWPVRISRRTRTGRAVLPVNKRTIPNSLPVSGRLMLVVNSVFRCQAAWSAAKRETRVLATGVPANHSATRTKLMAVAVMTCWRCVLARPV